MKFTIKADNGQMVTPLGPEERYDPNDDFMKFDWRIISVQKSRGEKFILVHYLGTYPKYWDAALYLINPVGKVTRLPDDTVRSATWTDDGKYILGVGDTGFRVWSTSGKVREVNFDEYAEHTHSNRMICFDSQRSEKINGQYHDYRLVSRYSIPELKLLSRIKTDNEHTCDP